MAEADQIAARMWRECDGDPVGWARSLSAVDARRCATAWLVTEWERRSRAVTRQLERDEPRHVSTPATLPDDPELEAISAASHAVQSQIDALRRAVDRQIDAHAQTFVVTWSAELRAQAIRMPDGEATTWGAATVEQHARRAAMFTDLSVANAEGAARHRSAIRDLESAGAASLDELCERGSAAA